MEKLTHTRKALLERIAQLDKEISEYPYWGAALTAMDEERRELKLELQVIDASTSSKM